MCILYHDMETLAEHAGYIRMSSRVFITCTYRTRHLITDISRLFRLFLANIFLIIYLKNSALALQYSQNHFPFGLSIKPTQPR